MRRVLIAVSLAVLACMTPACSSPPPEEEEFAERVRALEAAPASALPEHEEQEEEGGFVDERRSVELSRLTLEAGGAEALAADVAAAGLEIYVFNMAQADSTLVVGPPPERRTLLIDLGEQNNGDKENYLRVAERILDITGDTHIDYFLISHFHGDHMGASTNGIAGLLERVDPQFTVGTLIDLGEIGAEYMVSRRWAKERIDRLAPLWIESGILAERVVPQFGTGQIDLGPGVSVEIVTFGGAAYPGDAGVFAQVASRYPGRYRDAPGSENDISIGLEVSFGEFELFTAGDLTGYAPEDWEGWTEPPLFTPRAYEDGKRETYTNVETHLVNAWRERGREADVEVYRANHHGSRYSSSPEFLESLDPEFILYSCGDEDGNRYGHPATGVLELGGGTAAQLVTYSVANASQSAFTAVGGRQVEEIAMRVSLDGLTYTIEGDLFRAFTDDAEAAGDDVGEENRPGETG